MSACFKGKVERYSAPVHNPLLTRRLATTFFLCPSGFVFHARCMPPRHQRRTCLDWGCSRHAKLLQVPQISAGLALPTAELLSPHQPRWNCQRVRLSNNSIEQNPYDTLLCKSGNKASLASLTGWILALTARRGANGTLGPYWVQLHLGSQLLICRVTGQVPVRGQNAAWELEATGRT
jgi:hypothetical protein